ncbi:MAG TPA: adenylate/guanylate cyclase domain-containing protein [Oligoflexia bacterium]|nr:adenylate/guanylate cyclase domain-containing protein [Oligoflexia bacterium]HMP47536.1 adenylate/guanylate cyclase domain-containing protein [Oligoflexia bacterium]
MKRVVTRLFGLILTLLVSFLCLFPYPWGEIVDDYLYDFLFLARGEIEPPSNIIIVAIDEDSFDELELDFPWPRSIYAKFIKVAFEAGAKSIAFDVLFQDPTSEDAEFGAAIKEFGNVVLVSDVKMVKSPNGQTYPLAVRPQSVIDNSEGSALTGTSFLPPEKDGFIRQAPKILEWGAPLSVVAVENYASQMSIPVHIPAREQSETDSWINFIGPPSTIKTISFWQALEADIALPKDYLKDALIFVGYATSSAILDGSSAKDHYPAPYSRWGAGYYPGVEIHAQAAAGYLSGTSIERPLPEVDLVRGVIFGFVIGVLIIFSRLLIGNLIFIIAIISSSYISYFLFSNHNYYLSPFYFLFPLILVYLTNPFLQYVNSLRERKFLKDAFSTYLAPQVVKQILTDPDKLSLGGEEQVASIFFLDIVGFTALSERLTPTDLLAVINRTLGAFSEIILKNEGMIDKFIGDCIMAAWGIPLAQEGHEAKAVLSAIEIKEALPDVLKAEEHLTGAKISFRLGISTGVVIAGNVGGGRRFNYTALGNDVNLAARLESLNKQYGTQIMISEETAKGLGGDVSLRLIDRVRVVGQNKPVSIFEVVGRAENLSESDKNKIKTYEDAFELYLARSFLDAEKKFLEVLMYDSSDKASKVLAERCRMYSLNPPDDSWDGVYTALEK